ncbi:MAG: hypothetical protein ACRD3E_17690 [Terriglobales bacterium]
MSARKLVLICLASALVASAQTAPPSQRVASQASRPAPSPMKAKARHAATSAAHKTTTAAKATTRSAKEEVKPAGKRDPFVSPVRAGNGPAGPNCSVGKKCLAIDAVVLKGIVEAQSGAIAVVENPARRMTYFLRENDPVFNGFVVKITPDSIVFRENVMDRVGKQSTRDVVKKVSAPAV